ncbi:MULTISPECIES: DUF192 domain-containing protein [Saliphagus]|uniref:DUF192 domain-containing protein n=1 Tax=Saliphagus infecundisoli TaxID=1849069 RepID=A0ABD5QH42_9EURY|nr:MULTISPECIES: DUF192 domain-containing protein [Saliphagus]
MELVREPENGNEDRTVVASRVEFADSPLERARGLMFRSVPADYALVFDFPEVRRRGIHTLFVPDTIGVCWLVAGSVERIERMRPFRGFGFARADRVVELPAGGADGLSVGDRLVLEDRADDGPGAGRCFDNRQG